jgi:hypothetical protein
VVVLVQHVAVVYPEVNVMVQAMNDDDHPHEIENDDQDLEVNQQN